MGRNLIHEYTTGALEDDDRFHESGLSAGKQAYLLASRQKLAGANRSRKKRIERNSDYRILRIDPLHQSEPSECQNLRMAFHGVLQRFCRGKRVLECALVITRTLPQSARGREVNSREVISIIEQMTSEEIRNGMCNLLIAMDR